MTNETEAYAVATPVSPSSSADATRALDQQQQQQPQQLVQVVAPSNLPGGTFFFLSV